ncbi:ribose 5-phosphate isomerase B [Candidatus Fermentibacteria bacterium]|nr:ribose 5-phosphate isomerase B [Candidatus Fermentibacteria bacterium]
MRIAVASDHAGFALKTHLSEWLAEEGHRVEDLGTDSSDSVDYPDFAHRLCRFVSNGDAEVGLLVCNTGIGMSMAANRHKGIRAALCLFPLMASYARRHNDANVLALGAGLISPFLAREIVNTFLSEGFDGGRHARRTGKLDGA